MTPNWSLSSNLIIRPSKKSKKKIEIKISIKSMLNLGQYAFWSKQSEMFFSALCNMMQKLWISSKILKEQLGKLQNSLTLWDYSLLRTHIEVSFFGVRGAILFSTLGESFPFLPVPPACSLQSVSLWGLALHSAYQASRLVGYRGESRNQKTTKNLTEPFP